MYCFQDSHFKNVFLTIFVIFINSNVSCIPYDANVVNFIRDLVRYNLKYTPPYKVVAFICWSLRNSLTFIKLLSQDNILATVISDPEEWILSKYPENEEYLMFILDTECKKTDYFIIKANETKLLNPPNRWLLLWNNSISYALRQPWTSSFNVTHDGSSTSAMPIPHELASTEWGILLNTLNIHVSTEVMIGTQGDDGSFILAEAYRRGRNVDVDFNKLASWNKVDGIKYASDFAVARRRRNLRGVTMRVTSVITDNKTLDHMMDLVDIHIDSLTRVTHILVTHANEQMNTSMHVFYVSSWGYLVNGTWDGMMGHLIRDEADIAGTAMLLVPERTPVVQFLMMTTPTKLGFVFRQPPLSYTSNVFVLPFSKAVWGSTVALLVFCVILLYFAFKWENTYHDNLNDNDVTDYLKNVGAEQSVTWSDTVMFVMGAVTEQGSTIDANKLSGRIISIFLYIFVIFMITSYSASIVVLLQSTTNSIQTLRDLLSSGLELASHDTVYNRYFMKKVNDPLRREIYEKRLVQKGKTPKFYTLQKGVDKLKKGRFAFHFELGVGFKLMSETYLEHEKCGLKIITYLPIIDTYQVIQKNSPYKEIISIAFHKMLERGIHRRAYNRYYTKKPECTTEGSNFIEVGLTEFYPALLILVYGLISSMVVLVLELLVYKRLSQRNKNSVT